MVDGWTILDGRLARSFAAEFPVNGIVTVLAFGDHSVGEASAPSPKSLWFRRRSVGCFSRRERSAHPAPLLPLRSVATHNDYPRDCWRNDMLPIGLLSTDVRDVVPRRARKYGTMRCWRLPRERHLDYGYWRFSCSGRIRTKVLLYEEHKKS